MLICLFVAEIHAEAYGKTLEIPSRKRERTGVNVSQTNLLS
jgi:hypothetical protein